MDEPKKKNPNYKGRPPGYLNRATRERIAAAKHGIEIIKEHKLLPLDVMMRVLKGGPEGDAITDRQLDAAKAAAPYVHPRLSAVAVKRTEASVDIDTASLSDTELRLFLELLKRVQRPREQSGAGYEVIEGVIEPEDEK